MSQLLDNYWIPACGGARTSRVCRWTAHTAEQVGQSLALEDLPTLDRKPFVFYTD